MSCGVETTMDTAENQMFTELCLDVSYKDAQDDVKGLLFNNNKSRLLVYCNKADEKYFKAFESDKIEIVFADEDLNVNNIGKMEKIHPAGLFQLNLPNVQEIFAYMYI